MTIIPSILATTEEEYKNELSEIEESGLFEWVHIDFMDNKFVQNRSISPHIVRKYPTLLKKEAHLMVENPLEWARELEGFDRLIIHTEIGEEKTSAFLKKMEGKEIYMAFNHETEIVIPQTKGILIMGVHPGFQGQEFIPETVEKIKKAREFSVIIGVDGGINEYSATLVKDAGADYLVVGSHILRGNIGENLKKIQEAL